MNKILIIRLTSLGDVIFTIPLACALKESNCNNEIGWVVSEKGLDVVKNNPCVDKYYFVPLKKWKKRPFSIKTFIEFIKLIHEIRSDKYDIAIDCQQMFKSLFLFKFCGAKRRITFEDARELSVLGGNEFVEPKAKFRDFNYHIVERNLDFARYLGVEPKNIKFSLPETSNEAKNKIKNLTKYFNHSKPMVIIAPATTWKNKHWSTDNWAKVIDNISSKCNLVFSGTPSDEQLIKEIQDKTTTDLSYINIAGKTDIDDLIELFSNAKLVISTDSGSAHLAWATGKPSVVAIFTSTPPKRFGPYGSEKYFSIGSNLSCQPCFKKKCILNENKNMCCNYPTPSEIISIVNQIL